MTDLEKAVDFYSTVFGFNVIMEPTEIEHDESAIGMMCDDIFGKGWGSFRIAHLATAEGVGIELFQFPNAEIRQNNFEYWKTGIFHLCVEDPDVEGLTKRIVEHGGKQRMPGVTIIQARNHTGWFIARTRLETSSR